MLRGHSQLLFSVSDTPAVICPLHSQQNIMGESFITGASLKEKDICPSPHLFLVYMAPFNQSNAKKKAFTRPEENTCLPFSRGGWRFSNWKCYQCTGSLLSSSKDRTLGEGTGWGGDKGAKQYVQPNLTAKCYGRFCSHVSRDSYHLRTHIPI